MKTLVAYFSASGVTRDVASKLSERLDCDLYEIKPVTKYTKADLNWMDSNSRSSVEMKNKIEPEIVKEDLDVNLYDRVLLGYPIWWYTAPTVVNSFLKAYDFSNKKIILFATSGSSGFSNSKQDLLKCVSDSAIIEEGRMLNNSKEFEKFIEEIRE